VRGKAVVRQQDVHKVLSDVVDVALHRRQDDRALARLVGAFHERFEVCDGRLHRLGRLEHERQLHLTRAEQVADHLHPRQQDLVDDLQRFVRLEGLVEVVGEAGAVALDDPLLEPLLDADRLALGGPGPGRCFVGELGEQIGQRIVPALTLIEDQLAGDLAKLLVDLVERLESAGVHDGRVEPGLAGVVQEDAVQHMPGRRLDTEADVADAEHDVALGQLLLDPADSLQRFEAEPPVLGVAGAYGERQRIEQQVAGPQTVLAGRQVMQAMGDGHFSVHGLGHAFLVDGQSDHCRSVFAAHG